MGRVNLTECGRRYMSDNPEMAAFRAQYGWNFTVRGIPKNTTTQISLAGCEKLCGSGNDYYLWEEASSTITTWLLPAIGVLLQGPFESNATVRTAFTIARWLGSPISSLSYIFWNIKVSGKCALIVDMACKINEVPDRKSDFASFRDSLYILTVMNQYTMKRSVSMAKEAEGLLRIALFGRDLPLKDTDKSLRQIRRILARELRENRRRGVVPVFISTAWFIFAMGLSIQQAFGFLGENITAHDLALGCILAWLPILILASVVDRNPIAADAIRKKLNALVDHVSHSLQDPEKRQEFINAFAEEDQDGRMKDWVEKISQTCGFMDEFFVNFAGQGRLRFHYGAGHGIISDIENAYIAEHGRNWLRNEVQARRNIVLGAVDEGMIWFDFRELWQITSAVLVVTCTVFGAFTLSYYTPTVGLGCRSGGYTVFFLIAFLLLVSEMLVWWLTSPLEAKQPPWLRRSTTFVHDTSRPWVSSLKRRASRLRTGTEESLIATVLLFVRLLPFTDKASMLEKTRSEMRHLFQNLRDLSSQRKWELFFFRPLEIFNACWLVWIILAQTFGIYHNCKCSCSIWGAGGGYLDFYQSDKTDSPWVTTYWSSGTALSVGAMGIAMMYIVVEWCIQSFLTAEDYSAAMRGLQRTRQYRYLTMPFRIATRRCLRTVARAFDVVFGLFGFQRRKQNSILWTGVESYHPIHSSPQSASFRHSDEQYLLSSDGRPRTESNPVEMHGLSPLSPNALPSPNFDSPHMPISRFPPPTYQSSLHQSSTLQRAPRDSDTSSHVPLIQNARSWRSESVFEDTPRISQDSPAVAPDDRSGSFGQTWLTPFSVSEGPQGMTMRQGYPRQASDSGSPGGSRPATGLGIRSEDDDLEKGSNNV